MRSFIIFLVFVFSGFSLYADEKIHFKSQAHQDEFVYNILYNLLNKQDDGYYLEIGASEPVFINNTYVFEKHRGWKGISIDISDDFKFAWQTLRGNPLLIQDATTIDYTDLLKDFPLVIDYLSLDVDGYYDTVLSRVMLSNRIFKVITIEHDAYRYGDIYRSAERSILTSLGYRLLCSDISYKGNSFEDWWIHPDFFSSSLIDEISKFDLNNKESKEVVRVLSGFISNYICF